MSGPTQPAWKATPERGSVFAIRLLVFLDARLGRRGVNFVLWCVALYYALTAPTARRASRTYWKQLGESGSFAQCVRHFFTFARVALDRALFITGRLTGLEVSLVGHEHVMATRGAVVLGAHLGSFEALQALSLRYDKEVTVIVDFRNAQRMVSVMRQLAPDARVHFIAVDESNPLQILQVSQAVKRGHLVAILADRLTADADRSASALFLNRMARFPVGPFVMAHAMACPVLFACALYQSPNRYTLFCEPFAERLLLPRATRGAAVQAAVAQYAQVLERFTRQAPHNWFNFFDFWA